MVEHRNAVNFISWAARYFSEEQLSRTLFSTSINFDLAVFELFAPLSCGGSVVLVKDLLSVSPSAHNPSLLNTVPSAINALRSANAIPASAQSINLAGERLERSLVEALFESNLIRQIANLYGPSETTTYSTAVVMDKSSGYVSHIGRPIANTQIYILDSHGAPVPVGVVGELYIGGAGVARGYLNRPELTRERFLPDPFSGARMYRTGDLGRWTADGNIEFLGRNDHQVKLRGYRIELGEIEAQLRRLPGVREAVVVAREEGASEKRLVAYTVGATLDPAQMRAQLSVVLPEYMVPAAYVKLEQLPLTPNGKLDRHALPAPEGQAFVRKRYECPIGESEQTLAQIWSDLLKLERVGRHDNFFELGGHSLLAVQLISRVRQRLGVELSLQGLFARPVLRELAEQVAQAARSALSVIPVASRSEPLALSFAQERLWFIAQMDARASAAYHVAGRLRLRGRLDEGALAMALDRMVERHEALRTRFVSVEGKPRQLIDASRAFALSRQEMGGASEAQLQEACEQEARAPFDLAEGPVVRGRLVRLGEEDHVLLVTLHHIVCDGWSLSVLTKELSALYQAYRQGEPDRLPALSLQYADYAMWQRQWLQGDRRQQQLQYWVEHLRGAPELVNLPTDRPRPQLQDYRGASIEVHVDAALTRELKALSQRHGTTLYMTMLAGWAAVVSRLSGQDQVVIGSPVANRQRAEVEPLIGFFVNTQALKVDLSASPSVQQLLAQVRRTALQGQENQDVPFEQVVEELKPARSLSHSPIFQLMLSWQNTPAGELDLGDLRLEPLENRTDTEKLDLTLSLQEMGEGIVGQLSYATALFDETTVQRHWAYLQAMLRGLVRDEQQCIDRIELLSAVERHEVLEQFNATQCEYPKEALIQELFERQVERRPQATAVEYEGERLSYAELNAKANQLARHLRSLGVRPDDRVALCVERSVELAVAILATLKAGGAYVPLDPGYPPERLQYMLKDAEPKVLLTQQWQRERLGRCEDSAVVELDECAWEHSAWATASTENLGAQELALRSSHLAYVIYTSGSTGTPKGVMVEHRNAVNFISWAVRYFSEEQLSRTLFSTSINFDLAVFELFAPLSCGGSVVLVKDLLSVSHNPSLLNTVPSAINALRTANAIPASVQSINLAGERLERSLVEALFESNHIRQIANLYGPSETTTYSTAVVMDKSSGYVSHIGRPIANTQIYILDAHQEPVPVGVTGEIYIGGAGVARGYLNRPELTRERFLPDRFSRARMYRTGDLGRWTADGNIEFLGRNDHQVKLRGYRIELGEIEAQLRGLPGVREAVVVAREERAGDKRLVAYVVGEAGAAQLRTRLSEVLPEYMVPAAYVRLERLPLTPNGKLDRRALPAPEGEAFVQKRYESPASESEQTLAQIWSELLKVDRVGRHDSFFDLGGHSLLAVQLEFMIKKRFGTGISLRQLHERQQLAQMAERIEQDLPQPKRPRKEIVLEL